MSIIGRVPTDQTLLPESVTASPDGSRVAYVCRQEKLDVVHVDGHRLAAGKQVKLPLQFGGQSEWCWSLLWHQAMGWFVANGKQTFRVEAPYWHLMLSGSGKRWALWTRVNRRIRLLVDGKPRRLHDTVRTDSFRFSPQDRHDAYVAGDRRGWYVVKDGRPGPPFAMIQGSVVFSPDGHRSAYIADHGLRRPWNRRVTVVVDGQMHPAVAQVKPPLVFSEDSQRLAYWARTSRGRLTLIVDGQPVEAYSGQRVGAFILSPDGRRIAAQVLDRGQWYVAVDGQTHGPMKALGRGALVFCDDGRRVAWAGMDAAGWRVQVDGGDVVVRCDGLLDQSLQFSPRAKKLCVGFQHNKQWYVQWGDQRFGPYPRIAPGSLTLSPDGRRIAFVVMRDRQRAVVLDGVELTETPRAEGLTFSQDSRHLAYLAQDPQGRWALAVDGQLASRRFSEKIPNARPHFTTPQNVHAVFLKKQGSLIMLHELELDANLQPRQASVD